MKIFLTGVKRQFGIGKDSKLPYDMYEAQILVKVELGKMGGMTVEGQGFEGRSMAMSAECFPALAKLRMPGIYDLDCEQRAYRDDIKTTIIGVITAAEIKAA